MLIINQEQNFEYNANEYFDCSPEFGCQRISFEVDTTTSNSYFDCPIFELPTPGDEKKVELCSKCSNHSDCGRWELNKMKCEHSKCICGDNWLPDSRNICSILNTSPRTGFTNLISKVRQSKKDSLKMGTFVQKALRRGEP